jgi:uncharacterized membrane protein YjgN (DUF898 family)
LPLIQIVLAISLVVMFFIWAPWLASKPIEQLNETGIAYGQVPSGVRSFTVNHSRIYFRNIGTVTEEPMLFGLLTVAMVIDFLLLILSFPKGMRGRRKSGKAQ